MKRLFILWLSLSILTLTNCKTIDLETINQNSFESFDEKDKNNEDNENELSDYDFKVMELTKTSDVASAVIYVEPPEIVYGENPDISQKVLKGEAALKQNLSDITILPEYEEGRLKAWRYKEGQIYQIHTQTFHSTMIQLEPGEEMLEIPYISEPDVWRLSRGVGIKENQNTQYLIIKPDYSGLASTLIIITNRRVYQMELRSFKDHYMPLVQWVYPQPITDSQSWIYWQNNKKTESTLTFTGTNIENCSFDYKISYSIFKKPIWCPVMVYDDGKFTYIVCDKKSLVTELPSCFIGSKKLVNTEVHKNVIVLHQLIDKATLRLGNQKVTIHKKITQIEE